MYWGSVIQSNFDHMQDWSSAGRIIRSTAVLKLVLTYKENGSTEASVSVCSSLLTFINGSVCPLAIFGETLSQLKCIQYLVQWHCFFIPTRNMSTPPLRLTVAPYITVNIILLSGSAYLSNFFTDLLYNHITFQLYLLI